MEEAIRIDIEKLEDENNNPQEISIPMPPPSETTSQPLLNTEPKEIEGSPIVNLFEEAIAKNEHYQSGFWNGYFGLSKENYEGYLSEKARYESLSEEISHHQKELESLENAIEKNQDSFDTLFAELTQIHHALDYQISLKKRRENDLNETNRQIDIYKKESESLRNKNSFLGGILFLLAAFVFILGDLVISHEIVAYALNIKNTVEAWSFAVGLAMVSVLLKPAYDRLIEYPYSQDSTLRSKRVYLIFKILVVIFTIITLCVLGYFRYEAYRTDQLKSNINSTIVALQEDETGQSLKAVEALTKKSDDLSQSLVNSSSGMLAFVLSGVMFAIAGAICLGIAFPILVAYIRIWFQIPMKIRKLDKHRQKQLETIEAIEKEISAQMAIEESRKNKLNNLGQLSSLFEQRKALQQTILDCKKELYRIDVEVKIYEVSMGHEKGQLAQKQEETKKQEENKVIAEPIQEIVTQLEEKTSVKIKENPVKQDATKPQPENGEPTQQEASEKTDALTTEEVIVSEQEISPRPSTKKISDKVKNKINKK
jgi:Mg2+ and Co2+ transporter CorA